MAMVDSNLKEGADAAARGYEVYCRFILICAFILVASAFIQISKQYIK
jgi:hypothetical protein